MTTQYLLSLPPAMAPHAGLFGLTAPAWLTASDPSGGSVGSGGGTAHLLAEAWRAGGAGRTFAEWLRDGRKMVVHGGGQSRRLPAYAALGKPFLDRLEGVGRWGCGVSDPAIAARFQAACGTAVQVHESGELAGKLTRRQEEILRLFLQGHNEQAIARRLHIEPSTVAGHVAGIHQRLGTTNLLQLGWLLRDRGLL